MNFSCFFLIQKRKKREMYGILKEKEDEGKGREVMTFVYLKDWENEWKWWRWNKKTMQLQNFRGGGFDIDENAEYWTTAQQYEFDSWHELYEAKGVNPLKVDIAERDVWISPDGVYFNGEAHAVAATYNVRLVYGIEMEFDGMDSAEDYLIRRGWIKATCSFMWPFYIKEDKIWKITQKTYDALFDYCKFHDLDMPKKIEVVEPKMFCFD